MIQRRPHRYGERHDRELVLVIDCADLERSATFWCAALTYVRDGDPGGPYQGLIPADGDGIEILLQRVPDIKTQKNRLHLNLRTTDMEGEVARLVALGARHVTMQPVVEAGWIWHILGDPNGDEFCVLQPPTEHWADALAT